MKRINGGLFVISLVFLLTIVSNIFCEQTFYPNGRYGRSSAPIAAQESTGSKDQSMGMRNGFAIINSEFRCTYTGFSNYFRCTQRKTTDNFEENN